jgi:hypothetical protein
MQRPQGVGRARGVEPARPRQQRGHGPPVKVDGQREQEGEQLQRRLFSNAVNRASTARSVAAKLASLALGRATTTRCIPFGHRSLRLRNSSRNRRRTAFRTTAVPTLLDTVSPSRDFPSGLAATRPTRGPAVTFVPRSWTSRKSRRLRRRASLGNASDNPTSWPRTRPDACGPWHDADGARPCRPGCCFACGSRGSGSASTWTAGTCASTRGDAPVRTTVRLSGRAARITQAARSSQCGRADESSSRRWVARCF